jgi:hypothetical protein
MTEEADDRLSTLYLPHSILRLDADGDVMSPKMMSISASPMMQRR